MNRVKSENEKSILVKSGAQILGPMNLLEARDMLKKKHLSIIDEVKWPLGRWEYLRQNEAFADLISDLQNQIQEKEEVTGTATLTASKTETITDLKNQENQPSIRDVKPLNLKSTASMSDAAYGASYDQRILADAKKSFRSVRILAILISLGIFLMIGFKIFSDSQFNTKNFENLRNQAEKYKGLMLYDRSMGYYRQLNAIKDPSEEFKRSMSFVMLQTDSQTTEAKKIFEATIADTNSSGEEKADAYLGLAILRQKEDDPIQASENVQKALSFSPLHKQLLLASVFLNLWIHKQNEVDSALRELSGISTSDPEYIFVESLNLVGSKTKIPTEYKENIQRLQSQYINSGRMFLQAEIGLLRLLALANTKSVEKNENFSLALTNYLYLPLYQSKGFAHLVKNYPKNFEFNSLINYCQDLVAVLGDSPSSNMLKAVCWVRSGMEVQANKIIENRLTQAPEDPVAILTKAGYLARLGRYADAVGLLKSKSDLNPGFLALLCVETGDDECVKLNSDKALLKNENDQYAILARALLSRRLGEKREAREWVRRGIGLEERWIDFIELKDSLGDTD